MFFSKKENPELNEIKEAVEPSQPVVYDSNVYKKRTEESDAPLFVKVEKYKEMLRSIREMLAFVSGVKQLFTVLNEIEAVRADAINIMRATVQRLEKNMIQIDSELLRPKGFEFEEKVPETELYHIEDSLNDLQKQLGTLKKDLEELR